MLTPWELSQPILLSLERVFYKSAERVHIYFATTWSCAIDSSIWSECPVLIPFILARCGTQRGI